MFACIIALPVKYDGRSWEVASTCSQHLKVQLAQAYMATTSRTLWPISWRLCMRTHTQGPSSTRCLTGKRSMRGLHADSFAMAARRARTASLLHTLCIYSPDP